MEVEPEQWVSGATRHAMHGASLLQEGRRNRSTDARRRAGYDYCFHGSPK
jgi:hypothetical protein